MRRFSTSIKSLPSFSQLTTKDYRRSRSWFSTSRPALGFKDHREICIEQELAYWHDASPGSPFFLPNGTRLLDRLVWLLRKEYSLRGYEEVQSPTLYKKALWETSGHWENFKEDMFTWDEEWGLKPMNCPGHCLIFGHKKRTFKELPLRFADFGTLHRNEASGALSGLTRVKRFHQDDAHIFCRPDQIYQEIVNLLTFIKQTYLEIFKFPSFTLALSTRPPNHLGSSEDWDLAEAELERALLSYDWTCKKEQGAFYGPKIDVGLRDGLGREHQTATIQLDLQLPKRFELAYKDAQGKDQIPVLIHRAIYGSLERFLAILIEHYQGNWPFFLNPRQVVILPITTTTSSDQSKEEMVDYAKWVENDLKTRVLYGSGQILHVDVEQRFHLSLSKRLKEVRKLPYAVFLVVGDKERQRGTISVRSKSDDQQESDLEALAAEFIQWMKSYY